MPQSKIQEYHSCRCAFPHVPQLLYPSSRPKNILAIIFNKAKNDSMGWHDGIATIKCSNAAVYIHWCNCKAILFLKKSTDFTPHARSLTRSHPIAVVQQCEFTNWVTSLKVVFFNTIWVILVFLVSKCHRLAKLTKLGTVKPIWGFGPNGQKSLNQILLTSQSF